MDVNWDDPDVVSLWQRLAACIQNQYQNDLTPDGTLADPGHFGIRAATEIFNRALYVDVAGSSGEWSMVFAADPPPSTNTRIFCVYCAVEQGQVHKSYCSRTGVLRESDQVEL